MSWLLRYRSACLAVIGLLLVYAWIPLHTRGAFLSPDETAVAFTAQTLADGRNAVTVDFPTETLLWAHPRSFYLTGQELRSVGFLGWPLLLVPVAVVSPALLPWVGAFLLASAVIPFYKLLRPRVSSPLTAGLGAAVAFLGPVFVLYGNRGLFPNTAFVALAVWWLWAFSRVRIDRWRALGGLAMGLGVLCFIRPPDLLWLLPWSVILFFEKPEQERTWMMKRGALLVGLVFLAIVGWLLVHGVGYFGAGQQTWIDRAFFVFFPFGFHPRHVLWNVRSYGWFLWPWTAAMVASSLFLWRKKERRLRVLLAASWTTVVLLVLYYGQGVYRDHVRLGEVSLGNSFLRYTMPIALVLGALVAFVHDKITHRVARQLVAGACIVLAGAGGWFGYARDDESVLTSAREVTWYTSVRARANELLSENAIVLSDRSDKIFFPDRYVVSPMPSDERIRSLITTANRPIALFRRPFSQQERDAWREAGYRLTLLATFDQAGLFLLEPQKK